MNNKIEIIIAARLKLQSTQTALNRNFGFYSFASVSDLKNIKFCNEYLEMAPEKQKEFRILLGGLVNEQITYKFLAGVLKGYGFSIEQLNEKTPETFQQSLFKISKETGQDFNIVSKIARQLAKRGLNSEEVINKTKDAATLCKLAGTDYDKALRAFYVLQEQY
jgi:hypothetical protein